MTMDPVNLRILLTVISTFTLAVTAVGMANISTLYLASILLWLLLCVLVVVSLGVLAPTASALEIIQSFGPVFLCTACMGWYTFMGVRPYSDDLDDMPDAWFLYAKLTLFTAGATIIATCTQYMMDDMDFWFGLSILSSTLLFIFVCIEQIISKFFRTDGFTTI